MRLVASLQVHQIVPLAQELITLLFNERHFYANAFVNPKTLWGRFRMSKSGDFMVGDRTLEKFHFFHLYFENNASIRQTCFIQN